MRTSLPLAALLCAVLAACSSAQRTGAAANPNIIPEHEVRASDARNAYELVERLRPRWLVPRTVRSTRLDTVILVYQDRTRLGGVEALRGIPVDMVRSLRVLDAAEAGQLPGLGAQHVERVIMVSPRR
jgi:hypothetical protein